MILQRSYRRLRHSWRREIDERTFEQHVRMVNAVEAGGGIKCEEACITANAGFHTVRTS